MELLVAEPVHADLECLLETGEELLQSVRLVGDVDDLAYWRMRVVDWTGELPAQQRRLGVELAAPAHDEPGVCAEVSRSIRLIKAIVAQLSDEADQLSVPWGADAPES